MAIIPTGAHIGQIEVQTEGKGDPGDSAYVIALQLGFNGTKEEWIASLHGKDGSDGSVWYSGAGEPTLDADSNSYYPDLATGDIYKSS